MNPVLKRRGMTPTEAVAHRAEQQALWGAAKERRAAIRVNRNMSPDKFEDRANLQRSMAKVARLNAKKASLGQAVPEPTRPARWNK